MKSTTKIEKPVPTQDKADEIVSEENKTSAEPVTKAKAKPATSDGPYPTQADLDAIKEGRFRNREVKAENNDATYKTR